MITQKAYSKMSNSEQAKEDWMNAKWRPMMGWTYMTTCITDFIIFPVLWSMLQAHLKQPITPWNPLTLQGAGLFHVAMGAILGIAAYGRTQEKLTGSNNGGATQAMPIQSSFPPPQAINAQSGFPAQNNFPSQVDNTAQPSAPTSPVRRAGKPIPQQSDPIL